MREVPGADLTMASLTDEQISEQTKQIDALQHRYAEGPPGYGGWLSTLVHNLRNAYLAWPDGKTENASVQALVEGFLAEIEELRAHIGASEEAPDSTPQGHV